jgi:hypothetical protein
MSNPNWSYREGKIGKDKVFTWTSKVNDDISVSVQKLSVKHEPGAAIFMMKGTPHHDLYEGWFVRFRISGTIDTFLGGSVRAMKDFPYELAKNYVSGLAPYVTLNGKRIKRKTFRMYYPAHWRGPFTQEHALALARFTIQDPGFISRWIKPKEYTMDIPGWTRESNPFVTVWTSENDGRYRIILEGGLLGTKYKLMLSYGYADDPPEKRINQKIIQDNIKGKAAAFNAAKEYASKMEIPVGRLEANIGFLKNPLFAEGLKSMKGPELNELTRLIKENQLTPNQAVEFIMRKKQLEDKRQKEEEK